MEQNKEQPTEAKIQIISIKKAPIPDSEVLEIVVKINDKEYSGLLLKRIK